MSGIYESREFVFYKRMMQFSHMRGVDDRVDSLCRGCEHHRPNWEYRFCEYTECPMMKGFLTFREECYEDGGDEDAGIQS